MRSTLPDPLAGRMAVAARSSHDLALHCAPAAFAGIGAHDSAVPAGRNAVRVAGAFLFGTTAAGGLCCANAACDVKPAAILDPSATSTTSRLPIVRMKFFLP